VPSKEDLEKQKEILKQQMEALEKQEEEETEVKPVENFDEDILKLRQLYRYLADIERQVKAKKIQEVDMNKVGKLKFENEMLNEAEAVKFNIDMLSAKMSETMTESDLDNIKKEALAGVRGYKYITQ
jgi:hypothetical protein